MRSLVYTLREIGTFRGCVSFLRVWVRWLFWSVSRRVPVLRAVEKHQVFCDRGKTPGVFRCLSRSQLGAGLLQIAIGLALVGLLRGVAWLLAL